MSLAFAASLNFLLPALENLDTLLQDKSAPVITECGSGHRSAMAMMALGPLGYTKVKSIAGSFTAWKAANLPVVE